MHERIVALIAVPLAVGTAVALAAQPAPSAMVPPSVAPPSATGSIMAIAPYLPKGAMPDSLLLDPPPPAPGSAAEARDVEAAKAAVALRGTPRWALATRDADLFAPGATGTFSCAAGIDIGAKNTPKLQNLMLRVARELAMSTAPTKRQYNRARPFMVNGEPTCTPDWEAVLRKDGSYPSGHSAIGWGWGLVLAQVVPDRAAQLVARGRAFGDSRRICNVHWLSDVEEGRVVASAAIARLQSEPAFLADVAAAKAEVAGSVGKLPPQGCAEEAAALALH